MKACVQIRRTKQIGVMMNIHRSETRWSCNPQLWKIRPMFFLSIPFFFPRQMWCQPDLLESGMGSVQGQHFFCITPLKPKHQICESELYGSGNFMYMKVRLNRAWCRLCKIHHTMCFLTVFSSYLWNRCTSWALPSMLLLSSASCCRDRQRLFSSYTQNSWH